MIWKIQDYQGIFGLDRKTVNQVDRYLEAKETAASQQILNSIHPYQMGDLPPLLEASPHTLLRLSEAVEQLGKKIQKIRDSSEKVTAVQDWKEAAKIINYALWEYVELLEGCITELFQQLEQMDFEYWNIDLFHAVTSMKDIFSHHIDEAIWSIKRLKHQLDEYHHLCATGWNFWKNFTFKSLIDKELIPNLSKSQKYLGFQYQKFNERYKGYLDLYSEAEKGLRKFYDCNVLLSQDIDFQDDLKSLYMLLSVWELNQSARSISRQDTIRAVRRFKSPDDALVLFKQYFHAIKKAAFDRGRLIKKETATILQDQLGRNLISDAISGYRMELQTLSGLVEKCRQFYHQTDPKDRHITWKATKRSASEKKFAHLRKEIEHFDILCEEFHHGLEKESNQKEIFFMKADIEIERLLHEMGQPLISESSMRLKAQSFLSLLLEIDELASRNPFIVDYFTKVLIKAMRIDWKYHVFHDLPEFYDVYEVHLGLLGQLDDRKHLNRVNKFKHLLSQLENWVKQGDVVKHAQEIELDINDIKGYLQDFLAYIQRLLRDEKHDKESNLQLISQLNQKLLEYHFLFGKFFHHLDFSDPEQKQLRKQLLFVDQYFENIETRMQELRNVNQL